MEFVGAYDHRWADDPKESRVKGSTFNGEKTAEMKTSFDEVSSALFYTYAVVIIVFLSASCLIITCTICLAGW